MKKLIIAAIFAIGFGSTATAADTLPSESNVLLVHGNETAFTSYMSKKAKRFLTKYNKDWKIFNEVVTTYNNSPSNFMNMTADEKKAFFAATNRISTSLNRMRGTEVDSWKKSVDVTSQVFKYLWNNSYEPQNTDFTAVAIPSVAR